jgi:hypothetical protein
VINPVNNAIINPQDLLRNQEVIFACHGNLNIQDGEDDQADFTKTVFRVLKFNTTDPTIPWGWRESWREDGVGLEVNGLTAVGFSPPFTVSTGYFATQCQICVTDQSNEETCTGWDTIATMCPDMQLPALPTVPEGCETVVTSMACSADDECVDCYGQSYQCSYGKCQPNHCTPQASNLACEADSECIECYGSTARCVANQCGVPVGLECTDEIDCMIPGQMCIEGTCI